MKSFLIYFKDQYEYDDDIVIRAYTESEAIIEFYKTFPSSCRIKSIQ